MFVFIWYFFGSILPKEYCSQKWEWERRGGEGEGQKKSEKAGMSI